MMNYFVGMHGINQSSRGVIIVRVQRMPISKFVWCASDFEAQISVYRIKSLQDKKLTG